MISHFHQAITSKFCIQLLFLATIFFPNIIANHFTHLPLGNISPLFSFGQSIQKQGGLSLREILIFNHRNHGSRLISHSNAYYGITDRLTVLASIPIVFTDRRNKRKLHGLADISLRTEYVFYHDTSDDHNYRITGVGAIRFPTSTVEDKIRIASKTYSFFLGGTQSIITPDWYIYFAIGYWIFTKTINEDLGMSSLQIQVLAELFFLPLTAI
jgi:hypothetical protein